MISRAARWTIQRYGHPIGCALVVLTSILAGGFAGLLASAERPWPYEVLGRRLVGENGTSKDTLVRVHQGGDVVMQRLIDYHEVECERWYARRAVSEVKDKFGAVPVVRFDEIHDTRLPADLSGRWQEWSAPLPADFPCGKAYLVETVTAACTSWQRIARRLRKPDIITPFEVIGCEKAPG